MKNDGGKKARSAHVACDGAGTAMERQERNEAARARRELSTDEGQEYGQNRWWGRHIDKKQLMTYTKQLKPYTMKETAPKGTASSMFRQSGDCHVCNQLFLGSLSSFSLLVPYVCIIHNRSTDEDGSVSTEADTEYQGYGKTTDRLTAEDCDSKHCHESRY